jgi:hypothetical protein
MKETTTTARPWSDYPILPKHASAPKETKNVVKPYKPCNFTRHVNNFGNIDTRERLPVGYIHIRGQRLGPIARKVGARKWAVAFTGFEQGWRRNWRAITDGIVCSRKIAPKIRAEIARLKASRE